VKASFFGVVSFGRLAPECGSGSITMLTVMVNMPLSSSKYSELTSIDLVPSPKFKYAKMLFSDQNAK
jgi:hypothetical protein